MLQHLLQQKFGIQIEEQLRLGQYEACRATSNLYLSVPIGEMEKELVTELEKIAVHIRQHGDNRICQFLKTNEGEMIVEWEGKKQCVLSTRYADEAPVQKLGRKLSKFHYRGRSISFQVKKINRIGQWKGFWEKRLDQMERVWNEALFQPPENDFERMFVQSFPYYLGVAENAIQYLVDTELDENPVEVDSGTVCHERFSYRTWGERYFIKNPFQWVFDHCSRDLAEWTRERYFRNIKTYEPDVKSFFSDYGALMPLSPFSWRLLYARLLFPIHYLECVEEYYITSSEQERHVLNERLNKYLNQTREHERFLGSFYDLVEVPVRKHKIPIPEWLMK